MSGGSYALLRLTYVDDISARTDATTRRQETEYEDAGRGHFMAWMKIETAASRNKKFVIAGPAASWLWFCGLAYCKESLTDGFIPDETVPYLGVKHAAKLIPALLGAGLWHREDGGYRINDFLTHNKSAEEVTAIRDRRAAGGRLGGRPKKEAPPENLPVTSKVSHEKPYRKPLGLSQQNLIENPESETEERRGEVQQGSASPTVEDRRTPKTHPIRDLLGHYQTRYEQKVGTKPHIDGAKDAAQVDALLKQHDLDTVRSAMDAYFDEGDAFVKQRGYGLGLFRSQFNTWLARVKRPSSSSGVAVRTTMSPGLAARARQAGGTP